MNKNTVYLLHFTTPYKHAAHYIGFTKNLQQRLEDHKNGRGARLLEVIKNAGINFILAKIWQGDKHFERKLKNRKNSSKICPICRLSLSKPTSKKSGTKAKNSEQAENFLLTM